MNSRLLLITFSFFAWLVMPNSLAAESPLSYSVIINRKHRLMQVESDKGQLLLKSPVGIGAGGLQKKKSMDDMVTPEGAFVVDIVLASEPELCAVAPAVLRRYRKRPEYARYLCSRRGLSELFKNMNQLDFDGDGKPDSAYGKAYIGLSSPSAVTGPKMSKYRGSIYWYSIAMHGTGDEIHKISKAASGGCIVVPAGALTQLLEKKIACPGLSVVIHD